MIINDVNSLMRWKTGSPYTMLEWISSTSGTGQYIVTSYIPNANTVMTIDMQTNFNGTNTVLFGSKSATFTVRRNGSSSTQLKFEVFGGNTNATGFSANTRTTLVISGNGQCKMGNKDVSVTVGTATPTTVIQLMRAYNSSGTLGASATTRIYEVTIEESSVIKLHLLPAMRNADSVIGLYDETNDVFYTNAGTGTFTYG